MKSKPNCFTPHNHRCACGTVWHHDPIDLVAGEDSHTRAHSCPTCGELQWTVDDTDATPQFFNDGEVCKPIAQVKLKKDTQERELKRFQLALGLLGF
jgi:hypothetical protein